ncbi:unnamed protein product, partial [Mesorhabditis belari]|uniref:Uncharacterized protein n=1 Tax=Mesorhabditis belari TaxID=2138241 RepID=A0AAF3FJ98_9BILA
MDIQEKRVETKEKSEEKNVEQANNPSNDPPGGGRYNFRRRVATIKAEKSEDVVSTSQINLTQKRKDFSGLPRHLQELVLLKTNVNTRLQLLQTNKQLLKWTRQEGLFPRDLEKLSLHYGTMLLTTRDLQLYELKGKRRRLIKSTRIARLLEVQFEQGNFEMRTALPHLAMVFDAKVYVASFEKFRATFLDTSFKIRRALLFEFSYLDEQLVNTTAQDVESMLQFIDQHNDGVKFIDFDLFPLKKVFDWLKTQRFHFASFAMPDWGFPAFEEALNLVLKDGVPGVGDNTILALRLFDDSTGAVNVMRIITNKKPIIVSQTTAIYQQFRSALRDAPESMQPWAMNPETLGFKQEFDKEKNLVYLINQEDDELCLLIKFEPILAPIVPFVV